jgi:hypothetical protein
MPLAVAVVLAAAILLAIRGKHTWTSVLVALPALIPGETLLSWMRITLRSRSTPTW